jgi:hypothetical protein
MTEQPRGFRALDVVDVAIGLLIFILVGTILYILYIVHIAVPANPHVTKLQDKLDALRQLNEARMKAQPPTPPVDLVELNVAKWRAEYLAKYAVVGPYDKEGRHPVYWYTRVDGGFYGVEEVFMLVQRYGTSPEYLEKESLRTGMEYALRHKGGALLNPCYNYIAMESSYRYGGGPYMRGIKFYVFWMVAKWVDWTSPPIYRDGRFTAEGYVDPIMKPVAFVVRYAPHNPPHRDEIRERYSLGNVYACRYLDPPADCKDAAELDGMLIVKKVLDDGRWYMKIDVSVTLNKTGLYTFELIAEDIRERGRKCSIMHYTVEVPRKP